MLSNLHQITRLKAQGEKITCLTAYDASFAQLFIQAGVDMLMVGDSLGMVVQGWGTTVPVSLDHMIYHSNMVRRGAGEQAFIITDMPFMTYHQVDVAVKHAARLFQEGMANMVKMEGGAWLAPTIKILGQHGIPVCAHLGLTPQSVHKLGGYRVQGKEKQAAQQLMNDAIELEKAGADMLVLECVPSDLAKSISQKLKIATIGIGAGAHCDGQVLVSYDMLGITPFKPPKFVKNYMAESGSYEKAVQAFIADVKAGEFPGPEHSYSA